MRKFTITLLLALGLYLPSMAQRTVFTSGADDQPSQFAGSAATLNCAASVTIPAGQGLCGAHYNYLPPLVERSGYFRQTATNAHDASAGWCALPNFANAPSRYFRVYNLPAMGIQYGFTVSSFEFGVRQARSFTQPSQPVDLKIYWWDPASPLQPSQFHLVASATLNLANQVRTIINQAMVAQIPAGKAMVMEVSVPDAGSFDYRFIMGATSSAATAPSYMISNCTDNELVSYADFEFGDANTHWIINAYGNYPEAVPQTAGLPSGSLFPVGTTVNSFVLNEGGVTKTCSFSVTVNDTQAPQINNVSVSPAVLWPINHQMVNVQVNYNSIDNCPGGNCEIISISSNEPVTGPGSGYTSPDWEIVNAHQVRLRAERSGMGNGRVYTITIRCTDASGNSSTRNVTVSVPKSQGNASRSDESRNLTLQVSPNPVKSVLQVRLRSEIEEPTDVLVLDQSGRVLQRKSVVTGKGEQNIRFDLSTYTAGNYVVQAVGKGFSQSMPFILE